MCRRKSNRESARRARMRKADELHGLEQQATQAAAQVEERNHALARASAAVAEAQEEVARLRDARTALLQDVRCLPRYFTCILCVFECGVQAVELRRRMYRSVATLMKPSIRVL